MTPCQQCKAERDRLRSKLDQVLKTRDHERELHAHAQATLQARIAELDALVAKRHECVNCGPCPCTETD